MISKFNWYLATGESLLWDFTSFICSTVAEYNKYVDPSYWWTEMYAGRVACCPLVSHGESWWVCRRDRQTDRQAPDRYIMLSAGRSQHNNNLWRSTASPWVIRYHFDTEALLIPTCTTVAWVGFCQYLRKRILPTGIIAFQKTRLFAFFWNGYQKVVKSR